MDGVRIHKRVRLRNPYLLVAWPGMGEVAFKAAEYLVEKLKAEEVAEVLPEDFFYLTGSVIQKGVVNIPELPFGKFYSYKNKSGSRDALIFISNAQPDLVKAEEYSRRVLAVAKLFKVSLIVSLAAMPQPIEHVQQPAVWFAATREGLRELLHSSGANLLSDGQVSGMNGLFLGLAKREGFDGICFLGEIPLYTVHVDNPRVSAALLEVVGKLMQIPLDLQGLLDQAQAMEDEINKLLEYFKIGVSQSPIGEEEVERLKKTLGQLTRLPVSVREKIEKLFEQTRGDLTRAQELKQELDRWNVYKDYEDRFLDLFRRAQENN